MPAMVCDGRPREFAEDVRTGIAGGRLKSTIGICSMITLGRLYQFYTLQAPRLQRRMCSVVLLRSGKPRKGIWRG